MSRLCDIFIAGTPGAQKERMLCGLPTPGLVSTPVSDEVFARPVLARLSEPTSKPVAVGVTVLGVDRAHAPQPDGVADRPRRVVALWWAVRPGRRHLDLGGGGQDGPGAVSPT